MECLNAIRGLSRYLDGALSPDERRVIDGHLRRCPSCSSRFSEHSEMQGVLHSLPQRVPSSDLQLRLKVIASRERARQRTRITFANAFAQWRNRVSLTLTNMMRPLMVPVAGGFASACILFGMLVPDFAMEVHPVHNDVLLPVLYTRASVDYIMPIAMSGSDLEIDVHVDESGKMTDYQVISGQNLLANPTLRRRIESTLLISKFSPATTFGQPTNGRIRVRLVRDEVDVKG